MTQHMTVGMALLLTLVGAASAQYADWQHAGSLYVLTTPEGANLPAAASEEGFPLPIGAGKASGNVITLQLTAPSAAQSVSYLSGKHWDGRPDRLLYGANGIAALAFCSVPLTGQIPTLNPPPTPTATRSER